MIRKIFKHEQTSSTVPQIHFLFGNNNEHYNEYSFSELVTDLIFSI